MRLTTRPLCVWLLGVQLCTGSLVSCATPPDENPLEGTEFWQRYSGLEDVRALAIAGNPGGVWVGGASSGASSAEKAEREAMAECNRRRRHRRLQDPCVLYAVGGELVESHAEE